jgi:hypothetical protein
MLLFPSEMGAGSSSLFLKTKVLKNLLPPPSYKRRWESHNPPPHPFSALLWVSLTEELTLAGAQVAAATTPRRPVASVAPPS